MSTLQPPMTELDAALEEKRIELADLIDRHTHEDGTCATGVDALFMSRYSQSSDFSPSLPQPALCILAQGRKEVRLADEYFAYDPLNYLWCRCRCRSVAGWWKSPRNTRYWRCAWILIRWTSPP